MLPATCVNLASTGTPICVKVILTWLAPLSTAPEAANTRAETSAIRPANIFFDRVMVNFLFCWRRECSLASTFGTFFALGHSARSGFSPWQHPQQHRVALPEMMLERSGHMQQNQHQQADVEPVMHRQQYRFQRRAGV